jgi:hypothetical protein
MHKQQNDKKRTRSLLKDVKVVEVSFVGRGANQGAVQSLLKTEEDPAEVGKRLFAEVMRDSHASEEAQKLLRDMMEATGFLRASLAEVMEDPRIESRSDMLRQSVAEFSAAMASMIDNAQLTKEFKTFFNKAEGGKTDGGKVYPAGDYAYVPNKEKPSTWKLRLTATPGGGPDPHIVGAAIAALGPAGFRGQKVEIPAQDRVGVIARVRAAWKKVHPDEGVDAMPSILKDGNKEANKMNEEQIDSLNKKVDDLTARLAKSELRASMTDEHRAYYDSLQGDAQEAFGKAAPDERDAIVAKVKSADETVTIEGETVRKSDVGDATFRILKKQQERIDKEARAAEAERSARVQKELEAEAEGLWPNLVGTSVEKAEMLKGIKAMPEAAREAQLKMMKAADEAMAKQFKEIGQGGQGDDSGAAAKLEKMAKELADKENISIAKAYSKVLETPEGSKLYTESLEK